MLGTKLVTHSLKLIFDNIGVALRTSAPLFLLIVIIQIVITLFLTVNFPMSIVLERPSVGSIFLYVAVLLVFLIIGIYLFATLAVAWHRFILLNERPTSFMPNLPEGSARAYIWRSIRLSLWMLLFSVPILIVFMVLAPVFIASGNFLGLILSSALMTMVFSYLSLRLSVVLPATALGQEMTIGQAWEKTKSVATALIWAVLVIVFVQVGLGWVVDQLPNIVSLVGQLILDWVVLLFGITILTTLYGYCVEGRDLPA